MAIPSLTGQTTFLIPLVNIPQTFEIQLAGVNYIMTCKWNAADEAGWVLDISDNNNNSIIAGLSLVTGANILGNLDYLGINGSLYVYTDGDDTSVPTLDNLGVESNLYFLTSDTGG